MRRMTVAQLREILGELDDEDLVFINTALGVGGVDLSPPGHYVSKVYQYKDIFTTYDPCLMNQKTHMALILD